MSPQSIGDALLNDVTMIQNSSSTQQHVKTLERWRAAYRKFSSSKLGLIVVVVLATVFCQTLHAQTEINVSSLQELRAAIQRDNQTIVMKPGRYALTDLPKDARNLPIAGSNNTIDLSGVHVTALVGETGSEQISILGNGNVLKGGTFEDVYKSGLVEVTDFSAYNKDRRHLARGTRGTNLSVRGNDNTVINTKLIVRGSFPYGYGSMYGINADNGFGLNKRSGLLVNGKRNILDGCEVQQRAFGHGIFIQSPAVDTVVRNCIVEGAVRPSNDLYLEKDPEDLPFRSNYRGKTDRDTINGPPIPKDTMIALSEDGIRVYTDGGNVTVENCIVKKMRGGIRTYLSSGATVSNCIAVDCGLTNFNLPNRGRITASTGNFAYAPLIDFPGNKSGQVIQLTIAPSPNIVGPHNVADIVGKGHTIIFRRLPGPIDTNLRPIVVSASKSTIRNETEYPIMLNASATKNTIYSFGPVSDRGSDNVVKRIQASVGDKDEPDSQENQFRVWESNDGVKVLAKLVTKKGKSVTLATVDGSKVTGRLGDLSKADRAYLADLDKSPPIKTPNSKKPPPKDTLRTWKSTNGKFTVKAKLVRKKGGSVVLEKADGSSLTVPLDKLSKADQDYVDEQ